MSLIPTIDEMIDELKRLGWRMHRGKDPFLWTAPNGDIFRGPYRAWTVASGQTRLHHRKANTKP